VYTANSFLKTLEEPPDRAVLILIASNLDALLPTIRSRCQMIRFAPLQTADVEEMLIAQGLVQSEADARFASALSEGSLSTARQLLEPELRSLRTLLCSQLSQLSFSASAISKQLLEGLAAISTDTAEQRRNAKWLIRFTVEFFRESLRLLSEAPDQTAASSTESSVSTSEARSFANRIQEHHDYQEILGSLIDRTVDASGHLDQNVPVPMTLESLFDDLSRKLRAPTPTR
jgi:DNA polymerase-3 subunit delta'